MSLDSAYLMIYGCTTTNMIYDLSTSAYYN